VHKKSEVCVDRPERHPPIFTLAKVRRYVHRVSLGFFCGAKVSCWPNNSHNGQPARTRATGAKKNSKETTASSRTRHLGVRMKDGEPPRFSSVQEELEYWKRNALERKAELEELEVDYQEIRDSSRILEEEMERELKTTNTKLEEVSKAYANLASRSEDTAVRYSADPKEDLNINNLYSRQKIDRAIKKLLF